MSRITHSFKLLASSLSLLLLGLVGVSVDAHAKVDGAAVVVTYNGTTYASTTVQTAAIVTPGGSAAVNSITSYIEIVFLDAAGHQFMLRIESASQPRIEAYYAQLVNATGRLKYQISAYSTSTFGADHFRSNLDSNRVYFLLL